MAVLWFGGVEMPTPSDISITKEPVWSSNAGRSSTGKFIGDIICYKFKIQITWKTLSQKQSALIDREITKDAFFDVKFIDPTDSSGNYTTKTVYAGTPTYPVYSYVDGYPRYKGVALNLIEQ